MPPDRAQIEIIALEMAALAVDIETIGTTLCNDPAIIMAHGHALQSIDLIGQRQRALAELLLADEFHVALGDCKLGRIAEMFAGQA